MYVLVLIVQPLHFQSFVAHYTLSLCVFQAILGCKKFVAYVTMMLSSWCVRSFHMPVQCTYFTKRCVTTILSAFMLQLSRVARIPVLICRL